MYMYMYMYMYIYVYVYVQYIHMYIYICMYTCMCICIYVFIYLYVVCMNMYRGVILFGVLCKVQWVEGECLDLIRGGMCGWRSTWYGWWDSCRTWNNCADSSCTHEVKHLLCILILNLWPFSFCSGPVHNAWTVDDDWVCPLL